jgi:hypothetical protein
MVGGGIRMSRAAVNEILQKIEKLDEKDRLTLEREMARRLEKEWAKETAKARKIAKSRGITQAVIDEIIERRRYGK